MSFECTVEDGRTASQIVQFLLHECAYTPQEIISTTLGYLSILSWLFAQTPQFYKNAVRGSSESLSLLFLCSWLLGDICNLAGCLLTNQLKFQTHLAAYFVFVDSGLLIQAMYYRSFKSSRDRIRGGERITTENTTLLYNRSPNPGWPGPNSARSSSSYSVSSSIGSPYSALQITELDTPLPRTSQSENIRECARNPAPIFKTTKSVYTAFIMSLFFNSASAKPISGDFALVSKFYINDTSYKLGQMMAWMCTILYLSSRLPQIYKNYKRQSCDGLAIYMFCFAVFGNITYASSVLLKSTDADYLYGALPYLLGTIGTVAFDFVIFTQYLVYPKRSS